MNEEYLDIVDENNNPTGEKAPRSEVHSDGRWHRTVHIYFFRKKSDNIEFLVHLRSKLKDLRPNTWDTRFGGHLSAGDTLEDGVKSEIKEEVGIDVDENKLIKGECRKRDKFPNREFTQAYYFEYNGELDELTFNDGEVQDVKWMEAQEIKKSMEADPENWSGGTETFNTILETLKNKI